MGAQGSSSQSSYDRTPYGGAPSEGSGLPSGDAMMTPMETVHSLFGSSSKESLPTTQYTPVTTFGSSSNATLKDLLPDSLCSGGFCEGESPGCQQEAVNPIEIKQIVFKLSRAFSIQDIFGQKNAGDALAYGLALMPQAVEVGQEAVQEAVGSPTPAPADSLGSVFNRRLNTENAPMKGFGESDILVATIVKPMNYRFDEFLIRRIVKNGGFSLLSDGREKTHGPVRIESVSLRDHPVRDHPGVRPTQRRLSSLLIGGESVAAVFAVGYFVFQAAKKSIRYEVAPQAESLDCASA